MYYKLKNTAGVTIPVYESNDGRIDTSAVVSINVTDASYKYYLNEAGTFPYVKSQVRSGHSTIYVAYGRANGFLPSPQSQQEGLIEGPNPLILCAVRVKYTDEQSHVEYDYLDVRAYPLDVATFVSRWNAGSLTSDGWLYRGNWADASNLVEEAREWDDTPVQDGGNTPDVEGGENADTDPFDFTQNQSVWPDPDADFISPYATDAHGNPIPGLYTPYELTPTQLQALGAVLYDSDMFDTLVQKLNGSSNPISGILRCIQIPVVTNLGSGSYNIAVFGEELHSENHANPTGAHLRGRWVTKEGGSVTLKEVWGTYRDYTDTQVSIYLPFVGVRQLDPQLCVGKTLALRCYIDAYTGDVLWLLRSSNSGIGGKFYESGGFIGRWTGNCATEIPIGRIDNGRPLASLIGAIGVVGGMAASVMAPSAALLSVPGASMAGAGGAGAAGAITAASGLLTGGLQSMGVVSGNITGHLGTADVLYPYLIVQRSVPDYPKEWRGKIGAVKNETYQVNALSGYTLFSQIYLENMEGASGEEIAALTAELCSEGIIL